MTRKKIFLLSLNKCGTGTFHHFFVANSIRSIHHGTNDVDKNIALAMYQNFMLARDPLTSIDQYTAYSDISYFCDVVYLEGAALYPYIYSFYPEAYYILSVRDREDWIRSRFTHAGGSLVTRAKKSFRCTENELATLWRHQFDAHNANVSAFFKKAEARFLYFDLENDNPERVVDFLKPDFALSPSSWVQRNRTKDKQAKLSDFHEVLRNIES